MATVTIWLNDINTRINLDCEEDITTAAVVKIKYKKPVSGTVGFFAGAAYNSIYASYVTQDGDIDEVGDWIVQAYVELSGGWEGHGDQDVITVKRPL